MSDSRRKIILNYLRDTTFATSNITKANGFHVDLATVRRGVIAFDALPNEAFPAIVVGKGDETRKTLTKVDYDSDMLVTVWGYVRKDEATADGMLAELDDLISDITKAIEADRTLGNNAKFARVETVGGDEGDSMPFALCSIVLRIGYVGRGGL